MQKKYRKNQFRKKSHRKTNTFLLLGPKVPKKKPTGQLELSIKDGNEKD